MKAAIAVGEECSPPSQRSLPNAEPRAEGWLLSRGFRGRPSEALGPVSGLCSHAARSVTAALGGAARNWAARTRVLYRCSRTSTRPAGTARGPRGPASPGR